MSGARNRPALNAPWIPLAVALAAATPAAAGIGDGLLAYYPFEGNAADSSGNANHGTPIGAPGYTAGYLGQAIALDGVDDVVQLPASLWTGEFTTSFRVRTTAIAPTGTAWWQGLGMVDGEVCGSPPGGDFGIAMIDGGHVIMDDYKTTSEINDGLFHSVIVTRAITGSDTANLYVDGQLEATYQAQATGFTGLSWIGVGNDPCDVQFGRLYFPGDIDELRFHDRVLSAAEIAELSGTGSVDSPLASGSRSPLASVFPNPARGRATLSLSLPEPALARLDVYDLRGARVRTLAGGRWAAGAHSVEWDGDDDRGRPLGPGVYFVVFRAGAVTEHRKLVLIR